MCSQLSRIFRRWFKKTKQNKTLKWEVGADEMAQQFGALSALSEDLGSIYSTHMMAHNHSESSFKHLTKS